MPLALIFGVLGQDGALLAKLLLEKEYEIVGVSRSLQSFEGHNNLKRLEISDHVTKEAISLKEYKSVLQIILKYRPNEIYNLAGQSSVNHSFEQPIETYHSIVLGTLNILESLRVTGLPSKLFNAGSGQCFGNINQQIPNESSRFFPCSPYGVAKSSAFSITKNYRDAYGVFACTGIMFNHESYLRPETFVTQKIVTAACKIFKGLQTELTLGNLSIQRDWGWAPEYVNGMWLMLQKITPDDYILATGQSYTLEEFTDTVFKLLGLNWKNFVRLNDQFKIPMDIVVSKGDPTKARDKLGWEPSIQMPGVAKLMVDHSLARSGDS